MNTQMARNHGHHYDEDFPHQAGVGLHSAGHEDEHREKKSVIKKVKAKAKKIKDTLGLKIHGHEPERDNDHDEEDDNDDDVEEVEEHPEVHGAPTDEKVNSDQPRVNLGPSSPFKEDPHSPKDRAGTTSPGNYQTIVTDPTGPGGEETDVEHKLSSGTGNHDQFPPDSPSTGTNVEPIIRSFGKIEYTDEPKPEHKLSSGTGNHDQFSPDSPSTGTNVEPIIRSFGKIELTDEPKPEHKLSSGTGNHDQFSPDSPSTGTNVEPIIRSFGKIELTDEPKPEHKLSSGTGNHDQFSPDSPSTGTNKTIPENPQSVPQSFDTTKPEEHQPEDMNVDEEPRINNQSSYTEKISSATYAIAGKAITAKNVVASKLGYGGKDDNEKPEKMKKDGEGEQTKSSTAAVGVGVGEYGWQIASTVKEKLTPVYEKVAGAGSAVVTKVQDTVAGTGEGTGTGAEDGGGKEQDKGVSMKDYLIEKFSPGEEDKALSEVISGVLHKRKEEYPEEVAKSIDKVGESPEVARRLGTDDHHENKEGSGNGSGVDSGRSGSGSPSGKGVVDRVKGVVSSWFGKGVGDQMRPTEAESSRSPDSSSNVDEQEKVSGGEVGHGGSRPST